MEHFETGGKTVTVYPAANAEKPIIYLNTFEDSGAGVYNILCEKGIDLTLVTVTGLDWNGELSPWEAPPISRNAEPFAGGAYGYLKLLIEEIVPSAEDVLTKKPVWRGIAGYSLAGLFAVYSLYRTDIFTRASSVSGSLWFPGIKEFVFENKMKKRPDFLYFSLGDKEHKTRNVILRTVRDKTERMVKYYRENGISTCFELNRGDHFQNADTRTAAGIIKILT